MHLHHHHQGWHEHCSDDDDSDYNSEPQRQRSRSFSDAQDYMKYESSSSFTMVIPSSPPNGLHHRSRRKPKNSDDDDDDVNKTPLIPATTTRRLKPKRRPWIQKVLLVGFGVYVILVMNLVWYQQRDTPARPLFSNSQQRQMLERRELESQRTKDRRRTTRPPESTGSLVWYEIQTVEPIPTVSQVRRPEARATLNQLCGVLAQNASLNDANGFPSTKALDSNARVFITGILSPLGMALALKLHEQCNVQAIGGIDFMYPNTVRSRLALQDRIQLLTTNIPKLVKPVLIPYIGLDPKQKKSNVDVLEATGEFNLISSFSPTHIVHLAAYTQEQFDLGNIIDPSWKNTHSPYVTDHHDPPFYQIHQSMISMEQLLMSLATVHKRRPQFLYTLADDNDTQAPVHAATKVVDCVLANTYAAHKGLSTSSMVAMRLPNAIYGPWSNQGGVVHEVIQNAIRHWKENATDYHVPMREYRMDLVHVQDVVDAMILALQYDAPPGMTMDSSSGVETSLASLALMIQSYHPHAPKQQLANQANPMLQKLLQVSNAKNNMGWAPQIPLQDGLMKTVAWHLDREAPFGPSAETGDAFLARMNSQNGASLSTCAGDDLLCHMSKEYLPCLSECNIKEQCVPSIFDSVRDMVRDYSEGCNIMLYTQSLGYNVEELKLHAEYMEDDSIPEDEPLICNFAFVPRDSDLVHNVINKVPNNQLAQFGIAPQQGDFGNEMNERRLEGLNGRLLYRGWILVWVPDAMQPLRPTDKSLLKLSPGKLFSSSVHRALFVEENFSVSPNIEDVLFLVSQMRREALKKRLVRRKMVDGKQSKFRLPAEPKRRAAILFAPLRFPHVKDDPTVRQYLGNKGKKLNVLDASKFMRYEYELDLDKEPVDIRRQREFYEKVPTYINRATEMRSFGEPMYLYTMRHWVRSRWVVHDLTMEESRLLRCDWYQEHVQWGTDLDQLSFAHVMAKRELERRMNHDEPDDRVKTFIELHPELSDMVDLHEWHALETESNRLYQEPTDWLSQLPDHIGKETWEEEEDEPEIESHNVPLYVRIISERMMSFSRKAYNKAHQKKK